ncbi:MAG: redoxin domain-containing protein [Bacteroidales bacterium]|nr:redoxin domain-containing protein [Bacteroidales bacterium]
MTPPDNRPVSRVSRFRSVIFPLFLSAVALGLVIGWLQSPVPPAALPLAQAAASTAVATQDKDNDNPNAPELDGGKAWLNTAGPVKLKDLKGKIVLLDFWTLCCINCIHIMPDLAKLEKKYPNELVVIGVHSAKFENEKDTNSIRKAILRYEIAHPVVNDADHAIWNAYGVNSWPTLVLIDPEGKVVGATTGEGNYEILDKVIGRLVDIHTKKKTLDKKPIRFDLVRYREKGDTPLFFPGKILADEASNRLFIADSTHHRIVITDLKGKKIAIVGTGTPGYKNGTFDEVQFDDPQGLALDGDILYVADRKNHSIRAINLKENSVSTVAGTGVQTQETRYLNAPQIASRTGLNSPWALLREGRKLYIAMAGHHQIWLMDLATNRIGPFAGDGRENIKDGPPFAARFAQPSGLASDGENLYIADSEVSALRKMPLSGEGRVETLIGSGLFDFGDKDGALAGAKLQHALGVVAHAGKLYVADTYNSKIKVVDPKAGTITTLVGGNDPATQKPILVEPAGLSYAAGKLFVADTNAHRIRVVDLATQAVSTLELTGVEPPPPQKEWLPPTSKP